MKDIFGRSAVGRRTIGTVASVALSVAGIVAIVGCGGGEPPPSDGSGGGRGEGPRGAGGRPSLPTMAVAVEPAARGSIATYYSATASLDPDKQADILARTSGVVERLLAEAILSESRAITGAVHELAAAWNPCEAVASTRVLHALLAAHVHHEQLFGTPGVA